MNVLQEAVQSGGPEGDAEPAGMHQTAQDNRQVATRQPERDLQQLECGVQHPGGGGQ